MWGVLAWCAAIALPLQTQAATYSVSNEAELRQAIIDANADGDPSSTITFTGNISVADPSALVAATKPLTIDTGAFVLSAATATGNDAGIGASFGGGQLTIIGTVTGGDAFTSTATGNGAAGNGCGGSGLGGVGVSGSDATVVNSGTISGGTSYNGSRANAIQFTGGTNTLGITRRLGDQRQRRRVRGRR